MTAPARLDVGVVGTGRVGSVLAAALLRAGHHVVAGYAVSQASLERARRLLPATPIVPVEQVFARGSLVLLTVPDDALPALVRAAADNGWIRPGQFLIHSSGRYGTGVLEPGTAVGALPMALHPVMTFTGGRADIDRLAGCPFGVTAPQELAAVAAALVVEMGGEPILVAESRRGLYHAALAHGANHLVTLVSDAMDLLRLAGVQQPDVLIGPLLAAALDNVLASGDAALTGPVARGDAGTVAEHLRQLSGEATDYADSYRAMARRTADRAFASGRLDPATAAMLLDVLAADEPQR